MKHFYIVRLWLERTQRGSKPKINDTQYNALLGMRQKVEVWHTKISAPPPTQNTFSAPDFLYCFCITYVQFLKMSSQDRLVLFNILQIFSTYRQKWHQRNIWPANLHGFDTALFNLIQLIGAEESKQHHDETGPELGPQNPGHGSTGNNWWFHWSTYGYVVMILLIYWSENLNRIEEG